MSRDEGVGFFLKCMYAIQERVTRAHPTIDSNHAQIHESNAFTLDVESNALANNGVIAIRFDIPADTYVHFQVAKLFSTAYAKLEIYKLTANGTGGTTVVPANHNDFSPNLSALTITKGVTGYTLGQRLQHMRVGGGLVGGNKTTGGDSGQPEEWVMAPLKSYLVLATNISGSAADIVASGFWYEEEGA